MQVTFQYRFNISMMWDFPVKSVNAAVADNSVYLTRNVQSCMGVSTDDTFSPDTKLYPEKSRDRDASPTSSVSLHRRCYLTRSTRGVRIRRQ
jgi:hypothetical protein